MPGPLRISVVSYLNAEPYMAGLTANEHTGFSITEDIPSVCADKLLAGHADLGLVPVAMLPLLQEKGGSIVTDYCIAADDKVASVILFSEVPVSEIKAVYLDAESRTSVTLIRLLASEYFHISPEWLREDEHSKVEGNTARLLIGDRALHARGKFRYETDLAESWKNFTGLPFVFACWVAMRKLTPSESEELEHCFAEGMKMRAAIAASHQSRFTNVDLNKYLFKNIRYHLEPEMQKGLFRFLEYLAMPEHQALLPSSRL